jgi:sulfur carrier protein ThiS adenylyltransferase
MGVKRLGASFICVGDFSSDVADGLPPLAPRVMQAAALQADAVLTILLRE